MNLNVVQDLRNRYATRRTLFHYFKDRYALWLLAGFAGDGRSIAEIKRSRYAGLLRKPLVRQIIASCPSGRLTSADVQASWGCSAAPCVYRLTLDAWKGAERYWRQHWQQTSRPGANLVVQLNFSNQHNQAYERLLQPRDRHPFQGYGHPIAENERTLAWSRLDLDLETGEALIEEVQNDWLRRALRHERRVRAAYSRKKDGRRPAFRWDHQPKGTVADFFRYLDVLRPHTALWDEALLTATLMLLQTLGIRRVYYHSFASGNVLKGIKEAWGQPPRSLYTKLPRRFCFALTDEVPHFLLAHRRARKGLRDRSLRFFALDLAPQFTKQKHRRRRAPTDGAYIL